MKPVVACAVGLCLVLLVGQAEAEQAEETPPVSEETPPVSEETPPASEETSPPAEGTSPPSESGIDPFAASVGVLFTGGGALWTEPDFPSVIEPHVGGVPFHDLAGGYGIGGGLFFEARI